LIAARYKNSSTVWAYDLANEPVVSKQYPYNYTYPLDNTILMWPSLADSLVKVIREIDPVKAIIIESLNYGITLDDIKPIDASIPNIIYSAHVYQPGKLTGQFGPETPIYSYPGTIDGVYYDKAKLKELLAPLKAYQDKYRVPIYIGEFSCIRWAPNNSAYKYIRDCIEIFEEYNWDWSFFAYREWNGWSVEHSTGYYDNVLPATKTDRELLLRSYFQQNTTTGIQNPLTENLSANYYPNPVNDILHIKLPENNNRFMLYDIVGNKVYDQHIHTDYQLDMSNYKTGIYIFRAENAKGTITGKVIKK